MFPSNDDDVITSPYNAMLALNMLIDHADCVLPVDNQALFDIVSRVDNQQSKMKQDSSSGAASENKMQNGSSVLESGN